MHRPGRLLGGPCGGDEMDEVDEWKRARGEENILHLPVSK